MIRKLRLKFVAVCMLLVTAVLGVVFSSVYSSAEQNIERTSRAVLQRVISQDPDLTPGGGFQKPDSSLDLGGGKVQLPYFTVEIWGGKAVYVTGGTYSNLEDTDILANILSECLGQGTTEGTIADYHLRYLRQDNGLYTQVAFVDMSMEQSTLNDLMRSYLQIGIAALALLLGVSVLLSYWVTRPVEKAWLQQRQFLSDASHELKTPLTVILSNAELMESAALPERPSRWADNIYTEGQRMKTLVEEMLTLARADNMVHTAIFSEVNFSEIATDSALLFEPVAFEAGKLLQYTITDHIRVTGDPDKLKQVISVLLDNAIKYGRHGGTITLSLIKTDKHARLLVANENEGDPIPPDQLSHLFERFYRADASRGEQSGFGLGLPIASTIAAEHKGTLKAESDSSSTRFLFILPLKN